MRAATDIYRSTARAARVRVRHAGGRGRGGERRSRDCDFRCLGEGLSRALGGHSDKMHDVCTMLPYIKIRLLCLVVVFNSPKQSSARPERLVVVLY